jgi:Kef-type K+ transport system membrane component KefB
LLSEWLSQVRSFDKLEIIFAPLFFAIIGAQVNLTGFNLGVLFLSAIVIAIAIVTKLIGWWATCNDIFEE